MSTFVGDPKGRAFQGPPDPPEPKPITGAPFYPLYYVSLAKTCREYGYALTVHGSMKRDLDLVAIPWTEEAVDEKTLTDALVKEHGLMEGNPQGKEKPQGRKCYTYIGFGGEETGYIDLSVMPLNSSLSLVTKQRDAFEKLYGDLTAQRDELVEAITLAIHSRQCSGARCDHSGKYELMSRGCDDYVLKSALALIEQRKGK